MSRAYVRVIHMCTEATDSPICVPKQQSCYYLVTRYMPYGIISQ